MRKHYARNYARNYAQRYGWQFPTGVEKKQYFLSTQAPGPVNIVKWTSISYQPRPQDQYQLLNNQVFSYQLKPQDK